MTDDEDGIEIEIDGEASAEPPPVPHPRENTLLLGHEGAEAALLQAFNAGRLPHAWLITGPRGIGKATLAYRFARFLLAEGADEDGALFAAPPDSLNVAASNPAARLVTASSHPDLLVVERSFDPRRKRLRREIVADETRAVANFLHLTSGQGGYRVVIVDGADSMNVHAANGLLKILEEPPKRAVLLLASDNPGRLLPTIRSRCRTLTLKPLANPLIKSQLLPRYRPDLGEREREVLAGLAEGSIGRALELAVADGLKIYNNIFSLLSSFPDLKDQDLHQLADDLSRPGADDRFALLSELLPATVARLVTLGAGGEAEPGASADERRLLPLLRRQGGLDRWVEVWEKLNDLFAQAEGINLDRKQVVLNAFFALEEAAR